MSDGESYNQELSSEDHELIQENEGKKKGRLKKISQVEDDEPNDESQEFNNKDEEIQAEQIIQQLFEPEDREKEFLTKTDELIIKEDFPERMNLRNQILNRTNEKVDEITDQ